MQKENTQDYAVSFHSFLTVLNVDGLVENVKIEPKKKGILFSQVSDPDNIMMGEITLNNKNLSSMVKEPIAIFDIHKLISMVSYVDDTSQTPGELTIEKEKLTYGNGPKSVLYRLGDDSVMRNVDLEKTLADFIEQQQVSFRLTNSEIRELLKALTIAEKDGELHIFIDTECASPVQLVVGKIDKVFLNPTCVPTFMTETENNMKISLQTKVMIRVLKTMLLVPNAEAVIHCKPNYPAVLQLSSTANKTLTAGFMIAPLQETDMD